MALSTETQEITSGMELIQLNMKRNYRKETSGGSTSLCATETSLCAENTAVPPESSTTQVPLIAVFKVLYLPTTAKTEVPAAPHT